MEQSATGTGKLPYYSKLQELLTSDRSTRRSDLVETSSVASVSGDSLGDDGTNSSSDAMSDKYRNPRKRLLLSSMNASEADESTDDQSEKGKKMMKWKSDAPNGAEAGGGNQVSEDDTKGASNGGTVSQEGTNDLDGAQKPPVKPKDDYEYMGAQIDKLLSMPSPKSSWKAPRRQRKFQCHVCPKSYSTEDDLKSHVMSHSQGDGAKPFACDECDKKFKWVASLKVHKQKAHQMKSPGGGTATEYESESSQEENSPSKEEQPPQPPPPPPVEREEKAKMEVVKKALPASSNLTLSQQELSKSFESVVSKMLSSGLVSNAAPVEKSLPTRRQCTTAAAAAKDAPSTKKSTPARKNGKSNRTAKLKISNDTKKKAPSPAIEEAEEPESPQTPTTGRTSLRRNIQRPKWLSDADLVTDYEFPRGTNAMRTGITPTTTSSPSTSTASTPVVNGSQSQSRHPSTESTDEPPAVSPPKSQKNDKNKVIPPSSRDRKRKEEMEKGEPKKKATAKKAEKKEAKPENPKPSKNMRSAVKKSSRQKNQTTDESSPTKQLSTKILTLTLEDIANKDASIKVTPEKNTRKRTGSESPVTTAKAPENRKSKRKRSIDPEEKNKQLNGIDASGGASTAPILPINPRFNDGQQSILENSVDGGVETINDPVSSTNDKITPHEIASNHQSEESGVLMDTNNLNSDKENKNKEATPSVSDSAKTKEVCADQGEDTRTVDNDTTETIKTADDIRIEPNHVTGDGPPKGGESSTALIMGANNSSECETQKLEAEALPISPSPFFNNCDALSFGDIAKGITSRANSTAGETQLIEEKTESSTVIERLAAFVPPVCNNDEDMPILRPETSSSAAGSRSDSFAERMQSIDEDVSSSSNHSILPQAPVLSKEAIPPTTFANGIVKIPEDCTTESSNSRMADNQEEFPLIDGEEGAEANSRLRRDRSDSLSMRSCGSGSQSEKIKALEDTAAAKAKRTVSDHECLVDSDSNDSLMSEFSELAAQLSEQTDGVKFKEECIRFISTKVSSKSMWAIRKELKRLKKDKNYFKFGKLSPLAAGLMHDIFCQSLE